MAIQVRVFMGYICTSEVSMHLHQSATWKEAKLLATLKSASTPSPFSISYLYETDWEGKKYIGAYISSYLHYFQLKEMEKNIESLLQNYCPKLNLENRSVHLFCQLFYS